MNSTISELKLNYLNWLIAILMCNYKLGKAITRKLFEKGFFSFSVKYNEHGTTSHTFVVLSFAKIY